MAHDIIMIIELPGPGGTRMDGGCEIDGHSNLG